MDFYLHMGDCLELMPSVPDGSVDMILCDLPYGTTACKWDTVLPLDRLWQEYRRVAKPDAAIVLTSSMPFTAALVSSALRQFKYDWIWHKTAATGHLNANRRPLVAHESVLVFSFGKPPYYPQKTYGHPRKVSSSHHKRGCVKTQVYGCHGLSGYDSTDRFPRSVQTFKSDKQKSALHPTQKPVALMEYLVLTYTEHGATVLDNCMGSGTTGVACANTGRNFIGMEKDESIFLIAKSRVEAAYASDGFDA